MSEVPSTPTFVVCWSDGSSRRFHADRRWSQSRELFERKRKEMRLSNAAMPALYGGLHYPGGGIAPSGREPVGCLHAIEIPSGDGARLFACVTGQRFLPVLGPRATVEELLARLGSGGVDSVVYEEAGGEDLEAVGPVPPSEAQMTARAAHALTVLERRGARREPAMAELSPGELIWLANGLREAKRPALALYAADRACRRSVTPSRLNLRGGVLRDLGRFSASEEAYLRSLEIARSAEDNPYAYIGLAATLRRLARAEEAYDLLKRPKRFYPQDDYLLKVEAAVRRDLHMRRPRREVLVEAA